MDSAFRMDPASGRDPSDLLKAVADAGRQRLARLLFEGSFHVNELVHILGAAQSTVSRNLRILVEAGLLQRRREGRLTFYAWDAQLAGAEADLCQWLQAHAAPLGAAERRRMQEAWEARRLRARDFFDTLPDPENAGPSFGSDRCIPVLLEALPGGKTVLDLGCGSGRLLPQLADHASRVIAVDASPSMLEQARRRTEGLEISEVEFRLGDLTALPLRDAEVDVVVAHMVLHHAPEPQQALLEILRVLRPGGSLLLGDFLPHDQEILRASFADQWLGFAPSSLHHWLVSVGFEAPAIESLPLPKSEGLGVFVAVAHRPLNRADQSAHILEI